MSSQPAFAIRAATIRAATASARVQQVSMTMRPARALAMKANKSLRMCWNAPSTLREVRSARAISQDATTATPIPTSAVIRTSLPATSGG
jgi:hypothetical protein